MTRVTVRIARLSVSILFGLYFASSFFLTPVFHRPPEDIRIIHSRESEGDPTPFTNEEQAAIGPGLFFKVQMETRALALMQDPLLESDSRPDRLFRSIERSLFADAVLLTANFLWCALLVISAWTAWQNRWFARPLQVMVYVPSIIWLLIVLFSVRRIQLETVPVNPYAAAMSAFESLLVLAGIFLVMETGFPVFSRGMDTSFMGHSRKFAVPATEHVARGASVFFHLIVIAAAGLAASNVVLLPLFLVQSSFPRFFVLILLAALLLLAVFYVRAYRRVSVESAVGTSVSFLGFRVLSNTAFLTGVVTLIGAVLGATVFLAVTNTDLLQWTGILQKPGKL